MRGGASVSRTSVERKVANININKNNNKDNNYNKGFFAKNICHELIENIGC